MDVLRSLLFVPAHREHMLETAASSRADALVLDLEDSVAPREKSAARAKVIQALRTLEWGRKTRALRINDLATPHAHQDIIDVVEGAREHLDLIVVPKVKRARDAWWVDVLLTHAPPRGLGDEEDRPHHGIEALHPVLARLQPRWHLHGHIHPHGHPRPDRTAGVTTIRNVIPYRLMEITPDGRAPVEAGHAP